MRLTLLLMAVYLSLMAVLAVAVDRRFFVNDVIAAAVFIALLGGALVGAGRVAQRRHR